MSSTLCALRWNAPSVDIERGLISVCCRTPAQEFNFEEATKMGTDAFINTPYLLQRREEMQKGIHHSDCSQCWNIEKQGLPSARVNHGISSDLKSYAVDVLEIKLGIVCDLKCIYCGSQSSSSWLAEDLKFGKISNEDHFNLKKQINPQFEIYFWKWFETIGPKARVISFIGGEPFISPKFIPTLEKVIQRLSAHDSQASVRIVTNLNCPEDRLQDFLELVKKAPKKTRFFVDASMEAFGKQAEFIRHGLNWQNFERNMQNLLNENVEMSVMPTVNALSITSFLNLLQYLKDLSNVHEKRISLLKNPLFYPPWLSVRILDKSFLSYAEEIIKFLEAQDYQNTNGREWGESWESYSKYFNQLAESMGSKADEISFLRKEFLKNIRSLEAKRNLSFKSIFPEYSNFLNLCEVDTPNTQS